MWQTLIQRYDKKNHFIFYPVQDRETNRNFYRPSGATFMIVLIFFKPFFDNKMSIFEEYGAFKIDNSHITKTCLCNFDPSSPKPHFYIDKGGFRDIHYCSLFCSKT